MPINKPSQPLIPPTDVEEVEEIATSAAEAVIAADDTHAPLVDNLVPAANLPSYVDDVLEFSTLEAFPAEGEAGKIYVALDTNNTYRWSGSAYVQVGGSEIDLTPYALKTEVAAKQDTLISGTNIKTINGESILGEGDIEIGGDTIARGVLAENGIIVDPLYTSAQGHPYYFGGEYSVSGLSSDKIIDLAINEQVALDPHMQPPLFLAKNPQSGALWIAINTQNSIEIIADDEEHEVNLDGFSICYKTLSTSEPQEEGPDITVVSSIILHYNYPHLNSLQFSESRTNDQVLQLTYNTNNLVITAQELYNILYFTRNRELNNRVPKIPALINTDTGAVADEFYVQFNSSTEAFLCGSNGVIGFTWYHNRKLNELAVSIEWSGYHIGSAEPTVDSENHTLRVTATFENSSFNVTSFQCDDLKPNVWFTNEPTTIILSLTLSTRDTEWTSEAPITCYRFGANTESEEGYIASSYVSAAWEIQYNAKTKNILLFFTPGGCNFIDDKGNIAFTLSGLEEVQYNLYTRTPDTVMPIPAENESFDPSTLPVFELSGAKLIGDADALYNGKIYAGYGPMVPNIVFISENEVDANAAQFGQFIDHTYKDGRDIITVRLLDDQFNPLDATMVITIEPAEEPATAPFVTYRIYSKQLYCDNNTLNNWTITINYYIMDGWMAFEPHHPR